MSTAKRIQYHEYGGPEVMRLERFTPPPLGPRDVLVRVRAAGSNPMDGGIRRGRLKSLTGSTFPRGLGHDLSGVVEAVGDRVTRVHVGEEVLGFAGIKSSGAYGELAIVHEDSCAVKPATLSFAEAATLPVAAGTAYQALIANGKLTAGDSVLITGCLGAVGRAAVAIALAHGATVTGSARPSRAGEARAIGVSTVVDYDIDPTPLRDRFDVILDSSGRLPYADAKAMLRPRGVIVDIIPTPAKFVRALLPGPYKVQATASDPDQLDAVVALAARGLLRLPITETVPLDRAVEAIAAFEADDRPGRGKLVVTVP